MQFSKYHISNHLYSNIFILFYKSNLQQIPLILIITQTKKITLHQITSQNKIKTSNNIIIK